MTVFSHIFGKLFGQSAQIRLSFRHQMTRPAGGEDSQIPLSCLANGAEIIPPHIYNSSCSNRWAKMPIQWHFLFGFGSPDGCFAVFFCWLPKAGEQRRIPQIEFGFGNQTGAHHRKSRDSQFSQLLGCPNEEPRTNFAVGHVGLGSHSGGSAFCSWMEWNAEMSGEMPENCAQAMKIQQTNTITNSQIIKMAGIPNFGWKLSEILILFLLQF